MGRVKALPYSQQRDSMSTRARISAKIVKHSISPDGIQLAAIHMHQPRIILAEINTHRSMSKNTRSTRAVPTSKLIQEVRENPYTPIKYAENKPGMQAGREMSADDAAICERIWLEGAKNAADTAEQLFGMGLHKQWAGRPLEPYMWCDTLISSTDWTNFFGLRVHPDAQPEFDCLAEKVYLALEASTPTELYYGQWHLPYIEEGESDEVLDYTIKTEPKKIGASTLIAKAMENLRLLSAARCARIFYKPFDGNGDIASELDRAAKLQGPPLHASPFEHQATPDRLVHGTMSDSTGDHLHVSWLNPKLHGNFFGWIQSRKLMSFENINQFRSIKENDRNDWLGRVERGVSVKTELESA